METYSRTAAFIDLDAIYENMRALKDNTRPGTKLCAVVKADAYGHGAVPIARRLKGLADWFATATMEEAENLRLNGIEEPGGPLNRRSASTSTTTARRRPYQRRRKASGKQLISMSSWRRA